MPKTRLGRWAMKFAGVFLAFFIVSPILVAVQQQKAAEEFMANPFVRPFLIAIGLVAMASGLAAFVLGAISLFKYKERSRIIYIVTIIGLFAVLFLLGEFLVPH